MNQTTTPAALDLAKLEALALAATQGEWEKTDRTVYVLEHAGWRKGEEILRNRFSCTMSHDGSGIPRSELLANADFIAAANPTAILALIDLARRSSSAAGSELDEKVRRLEAVVIAAADDLGAMHNALGLPEDEAIDADVMIEKIVDLRAHFLSQQEQCEHYRNQCQNLRAAIAQRAASFSQSSGAPVEGCKWPTCQPEHVQQQIADQIYCELYSGEPEPAATQQAAPEAPAHETIVQEGGKLVCTACGTTASAQSVAAATAGWKLVPLEPTEYMREAAASFGHPGALPYPEGYSSQRGSEAVNSYRHMLAAAPAAPVAQATTASASNIKTWRERLPKGAGLSYDYAHVCAMKAEIDELRAALAQQGASQDAKDKE